MTDHQPPPLESWTLSSVTVLPCIELPSGLLCWQIEQTLSSIESLRYTWRAEDFVWVIEYGTQPLERGKSGLEMFQIRQGKSAAEEASSVATQWFPYLIEWEDNDDFYDPVPINNIANARWCLSEISIFTNHERKCLTLRMNRISGDHIAHWYIWNCINDDLQKNALFLARCSYLQLIEGTDNKYEKQEVIEKEEGTQIKEDHITQYLCDHYVARTICTYLDLND